MTPASEPERGGSETESATGAPQATRDPTTPPTEAVPIAERELLFRVADTLTGSSSGGLTDLYAVRERLSETKINSLDAFDRETKSDKNTQMARLYYCCVLDVLVDLTYQFSKHFAAEPHLYRDVGGLENASRIGRFATRYGKHEDLPDRGQRQAIYASFLGEPTGTALDGDHEFLRLREDLFDAINKLVHARGPDFGSRYERQVLEDPADLEEEVRAAYTSFRDYMRGLHGDGLKWPSELVLPALTEGNAYPILRTGPIVAAFVTRAPRAQWSY